MELDDERRLAYRARVRAILKRFEREVPSLGFTRAKKQLYVRAGEHWAHWISLRVPAYPARSFELEWGVRAYNDEFEALHLNGGRYSGSDKPFDTWFVDSDESEDRCAGDLLKVVEKIIIPWAERTSNARALTGWRSPLMPAARRSLQAALDGRSRDEWIRRSRALLFQS
ncbi:MAG: hypothetical protein ACK47B_29285 [Armatimonadota bacterium]